jgi:AmmeMemoRadiSam system protein B
MIPHIDFRVGGRIIARGIAALPAGRPPRLCIVLGVAHRPARNLFTMTDKSFETPLGEVPVDRAAAERLRALYGAGRLDGELAHLSEHSVEFAAVALRHRFAGRDELAMLPILCGSLHEELNPGSASPATRPEVSEFIDALRALIADYAGDVCIVASVDLSHVGLKFGDMEGVTPERMAEVRQADARMLAMARCRDAEGFFNHFRADGNARNVDAVTAVYVMLKVLGEGTAREIAYEQWREEETDSMVTFASMAFD